MALEFVALLCPSVGDVVLDGDDNVVNLTIVTAILMVTVYWFYELVALLFIHGDKTTVKNVHG